MGAVISRRAARSPNINAERLGDAHKPKKSLHSQFDGVAIIAGSKPAETNAKPDTAPVFGPEPELYSLDLKAQREVAYALCYASRFGEWIYKLIAWERVPLDAAWLNQSPAPRPTGSPSIPLANVLEFATLVTCCAREWLLLKARRPDLFPADDADEDEDDGLRVYGMIRERSVRADHRAAAAHGLSIVVATRPMRAKPTLPGCWGFDASGGPCPELRRHGDKFCPKHEREERAKFRNQAV